MIDERELNDLRDKKNIAEKLHVQVEEKWNFYRLQYEQVIEEVVKRGYNSEKLAETYSALVQKGKQLAADVNTLKASEETRKQITANMKSVEEKIEELQKQNENWKQCGTIQKWSVCNFVRHMNMINEIFQKTYKQYKLGKHSLTKLCRNLG